MLLSINYPFEYLSTQGSDMVGFDRFRAGLSKLMLSLFLGFASVAVGQICDRVPVNAIEAKASGVYIMTELPRCADRAYVHRVDTVYSQALFIILSGIGQPLWALVDTRCRVVSVKYVTPSED